MRTTRTYATMEVPAPMHAFVLNALKAAGYDQAILRDEGGEHLDMHGIALVAAPAAEPSKLPLALWKEWALLDHWHHLFVGSDIRQMLGEIARLQSIVDGMPQ